MRLLRREPALIFAILTVALAAANLAGAIASELAPALLAMVAAGFLLLHHVTTPVSSPSLKPGTIVNEHTASVVSIVREVGGVPLEQLPEAFRPGYDAWRQRLTGVKK
jgi:hypothetical protein